MPSKGDRIREQILSSADELFYHRGYADTAFAKLAEGSGIPKGNFYYYYKTKDAILEDVIARRGEGIRQQLAGWEAKTADPKSRLKLFVRMVRDNAESLSRYGCPIGTINSELGKTRQAMQHNARELIDLYVAWLTRQFSSRLTPAQAKEHASHLMIMAEGAALLGHVYADKSIIRKETRRMDQWLDEVFA